MPNYVKVTKIEKQPSEDVYNLEAETHHNFAVNGGFIVHNCMDALRYGLNDIKLNSGIKISFANIQALRRPRHGF